MRQGRTSRSSINGNRESGIGNRESNLSRLIVVSELYYPEETSTGYFITRIAERVAADHEVHAICAQPTYSSRGTLAPWTEVRGGVRIERQRTTRFDKDVLPLRVLNALSVSLSLAAGTWQVARRGDQVLVVTTPPLLPFTAWLAARLRGARTLLLVHDVYPDVLVATGWIAKNGLLAGMLGAATKWIYSRYDRLIVIGRDMKELVGRRVSTERISVITNWADRIGNRESGIGSRESAAFTVLYSGNIGRTHGLESLLGAAELLRDDPRIRFVISGWGGKRRMVESRVAGRNLTNVTVTDPVPREQLGTLLGSASLCVIALVPGMYGISVPSRTYNIMAAGRPILAIVDRDSEVWRLVEEEKIGWTVDASALPEEIARVIRQAAADPEAARAAGERARTVAGERYSESAVLAQFVDLLRAQA